MMLCEEQGTLFHVQMLVSEMRRLLHKAPGGPFNVQTLVSEMRRLFCEEPGFFQVQILDGEMRSCCLKLQGVHSMFRF